MASTASTPRASYDGRDAPDDDWPAQAADTIERIVGSVRDRTTGPALTVAKAVVYGTFAVLVGAAVFVLFVVTLVRLVDNYLPEAVFGETHMWAAHLIVGLVFVISGGLFWLRRRPSEQTSSY